jgi:hypothetical protein
MDLQTAAAILSEHGIRYREVDGWLEMEALYSDGFALWVVCPRTVRGLMAWLMY